MKQRRVLCVDVGNTRSHCAVVVDGRVIDSRDFSTSDAVTEAPLMARQVRAEGISLCSVVPALVPSLMDSLSACGCPLMRLSSTCCPGLPISCPVPSEVGHDRLANAIGAQMRTDAHAVVIDVGTATTFDILLQGQGYAGGIIAPGMSLMTHYLHEKTAQLPLLDIEDVFNFASRSPSVIGKTTRDAMMTGCSVGFAAMIDGLLVKVLDELNRQSTGTVEVFLTGGSSRAVLNSLSRPIRHEPHLTLLGLWEAFRRWISLSS